MVAEERVRLTPAAAGAGAKPKDCSLSGEAALRFTRFWEAYPRHDAKQEALRAWKTVAPDEILLAQMLSAVAAQRQWRQWVEGKIPHAATWLRGRRWEDERPPESTNGHGRTAGNAGAIQAAIARVRGGA